MSVFSHSFLYSLSNQATVSKRECVSRQSQFTSFLLFTQKHPFSGTSRTSHWREWVVLGTYLSVSHSVPTFLTEQTPFCGLILNRGSIECTAEVCSWVLVNKKSALTLDRGDRLHAGSSNVWQLCYDLCCTCQLWLLLSSALVASSWRKREINGERKEHRKHKTVKKNKK